MMNPMQYIQNAVRQNPGIMNNPQAQNFMSIIQSGDSRRGEEVANNLLATYGITKEQALAQARNVFHF